MSEMQVEIQIDFGVIFDSDLKKSEKNWYKHVFRPVEFEYRGKKCSPAVISVLSVDD